MASSSSETAATDRAAAWARCSRKTLQAAVKQLGGKANAKNADLVAFLCEQGAEPPAALSVAETPDADSEAATPMLASAASTESRTATPPAAEPLDFALAQWLDAHGWAAYAPMFARERFDLAALRLATLDALKLIGLPVGDALKLAAQLDEERRAADNATAQVQALQQEVARLKSLVGAVGTAAAMANDENAHGGVDSLVSPTPAPLSALKRRFAADDELEALVGGTPKRAAVNPTASPATARRRWADSPTLSRLFIPAAVNLAAEAPGAPAAAPSP